MKIKLSHILIAVYLILLSLTLKKIPFIPAIISAVVFFLENQLQKIIGQEKINLLYLLAVLSTVPNLLFLFLIYLPFSVFGSVFSKKNFIKSYVFGFAVSLLSTIMIYTSSSFLGVRLTTFTIALFFFIPPLAAFAVLLKKKQSFDFINISQGQFLMILSILLSVLFVGMSIVNNQSLFMSNGTYMFSKFNIIVKEAQSSGTFPIYDPGTSSGESPVLFESPVMFSSIAFANLLMAWIPQVEFYNLYTLFILLISTLSLSLLIEKIINFGEHESISILTSIIITLGALSAGLNFYFAQYLEAFKEFFIFPVNYLLFSLILEKPKQAREIAIIALLIVLSLSIAMLILLSEFLQNGISGIKKWIIGNWKMLSGFGLIILFLPLFYVTPPLIFKNFLEDKHPFDWNAIPKTFVSYYSGFSFDVPLSLNYPDVRRNDDKKFGPFISVLGILALAASWALFKMKKFYGIRIFSAAYLIHFFISSIITAHPMIGSLEYGYRTAFPYLLIILTAAICCLINGISQRNAKLAFILVFFAAFAYSTPFVKSNIQNIHGESFISGDSFSNEINFAKNLPNDGRFITYGLFSNAIDPGMAALTGKYFSRYHLTAVARSRTVYWRIHGTNSFGQETFVLNKSGIELSNYLRIGGYKYVVANICHPVGSFIAKTLYPDFTYGLYQNQCIVFFGVNGTSYAEKVNILNAVDDGVYSTKEG